MRPAGLVIVKGEGEKNKKRKEKKNPQTNPHSLLHFKGPDASLCPLHPQGRRVHPKPRQDPAALSAEAPPKNQRSCSERDQNLEENPLFSALTEDGVGGKETKNEQRLKMVSHLGLCALC